MPLIILALALAAALSAIVLRDLRALSRLPLIPPKDGDSDAPSAAIIIPARNEERGIERCVRGALSQRHPSFQVIAVDDCSEDATGAILARIAGGDERLRVVGGAPLPTGWTGKQHALMQGYAPSSGDWLLFLDADTAPGPQLLPSMIAYAEAHDTAMLTALPHMELGSFWERAILPAFASLISAVFPPSLINDQSSDIALANGQCILIRRDAYEAVGTHAAVKDAIGEDLALAQLVKRRGLGLLMADGRDLLSVRMYRNGREVVDGLTKNAMVGVNVGGWRTLVGTARQVLVALGPLALIGAALWGRLRRWPRGRQAALDAAALIAPLVIWSWTRFYREVFRQPGRYGLLYPLGIIAYGLIGLRAALRLRSGKGVEWKSRSYTALGEGER